VADSSEDATYVALLLAGADKQGLVLLLLLLGNATGLAENIYEKGVW
jgi:hypothetical protein